MVHSLEEQIYNRIALAFDVEKMSIPDDYTEESCMRLAANEVICLLAELGYLNDRTAERPVQPKVDPDRWEYPYEAPAHIHVGRFRGQDMVDPRPALPEDPSTRHLPVVVPDLPD